MDIEDWREKIDAVDTQILELINKRSEFSIKIGEIKTDKGIAGHRIKKIDAVTSDFIYCVSVTGVTGSRSGVSHGLIDFLQSIQSVVTHPLLVGFGISNPEDANEIGRNADGVIVGSAIIDLITKSRGNQDMLSSISQFVQRLKLALKGD